MNRRLRELQCLLPRSPKELRLFVRVVLGLDVPAGGPLAYLCHSFFERRDRGGDAVVWANRGGGKTMLGAAATLLDLIFKPGIQVRILGGSLEQSARMFEHLTALLDRPMLRGITAGEPTQRRVELRHGSAAAILAQSQRSVRGVRVHKLRCDEVEEFDPAIWEAAQLVTRSGMCGDIFVHGTVEALSTMHRPFGLMNTLTRGESHPEDGAGFRVFRWNYVDVMERCPPARACEGCVLWEDCRGRAKHADGFVRVDDLVAQWHRTSRDAWAAEMACDRPRRSDSVYPNFDPAVHVCADPPAGAGGLSLPGVAGMDFGLRSPLVMLWATVRDSDDGDPQRAAVHVVGEYIETGRTLEEHLAAIERQAGMLGLPSPRWIGIDPAGRQRNSHTGVSDMAVLKAHGYAVRWRASAIREGIERIRRRLDRRALMIHPRCVKLIEAMRTYHFDPRRPERDEPVKDGADHACDALRYLVLNLERGSGKLRVTSY